MQFYLGEEVITIDDARLKQKGAYAIGFSLKHDRNIRIGKFGLVSFKAGNYFYMGNAYGSGGLYSRLKRHIQRHKKKHWHFDYLRPYVALGNIYIVIGGDECTLVREFQQRYQASFPHKKLGSQDCSCCPSHLLYFFTS